MASTSKVTWRTSTVASGLPTVPVPGSTTGSRSVTLSDCSPVTSAPSSFWLQPAPTTNRQAATRPRDAMRAIALSSLDGRDAPVVRLNALVEAGQVGDVVDDVRLA